MDDEVDKKSQRFELQEGTVQFVGGQGSHTFPHRCPYQAKGADREFCARTTANLQHNRNGCCGTKDSRNIPPCNSYLRKCIACLFAGDGIKNKVVVDHARGLCADHVQEADNPLSPRKVGFSSAPGQRFAVKREDIRPQQKPTKVASPAAPPRKVEQPAPVILERVVRPYVPVQVLPIPPAPRIEQETLVEETQPAPSPSPALSETEKLDEAPASTEVEPLLSPTQIEEMAKKIPELSPRGYEVVNALLTRSVDDAAVELKIRESNVRNQVSVSCNKLGIPFATKRHHGYYDRLGALRLVVARYQELKSAGAFEKPQPTEPPPAPPGTLSSAETEEEELLQCYRTLGPETRLWLLKTVRGLKAGA